jgi:hypothetical protein
MDDEAVRQHIDGMYRTLDIPLDGKVDPRVTAVRAYLEQTGGM